MKISMKAFVWIFLVLGVLLSACSSGSGPEPDDLESYMEQPEETYDAPGFDGQVFEFSMSANSKDSRGISDAIESTWVGTFIITPDGEINGQGSVLYQATIFSVDEDECGYQWVEDGGFEYPIVGKVHQAGGSITIPLIIDNSRSEISSVLGPAKATCADPGKWILETPEIYFSLHRDFLVDDILLGLHSRLGKKIKIYEVLEQEVGKISYSILVDLVAEPLTE